MKYEKPEVFLSASALKSIAAQQSMKSVFVMETAGPDQHPSTGAYEADE